MKTYAIGDLHGRLDLLNRALYLAQCHALGQPHKFVVCGDFVDRGPHSRQIIERLIELQQNPSLVELVVLKGNHEDMMLQCINRQAHLPWWIGNGGGQTLLSYGYTDSGQVYDAMNDGGGVIPADHEFWLRNLPIYHIDRFRAFVHAGFDPNLHRADQNPQHMMWRYDGSDPEDQPNYQFEGKHVVHGHVQHAEGPLLREYTTNLDTFAWATGRLAIGVFEERPGGPAEILWAEGPAVQF